MKGSQWKVGYCTKTKTATYFQVEICTVLANFRFPNTGGALFETGSVLAEYIERNCVEMKGIARPYNEQCTPKNKFAHS